jgi:hypothetical protein
MALMRQEPPAPATVTASADNGTMILHSTADGRLCIREKHATLAINGMVCWQMIDETSVHNFGHGN